MANIGIVSTWFERGAGYVSRAYKEVLEQEHQVFVYARGGEGYAIGDPKWDGPEVTWGPWFGRSTAISMIHFSRWLRRNAIDLVLFNEQQDIRAVIATKYLGYPVGAYVDYYTRETVPEFAAYDFLICNTRRHHSVFQSHPFCLYIPWGTDPGLFTPANPDRLVQPDVVTFFHSAGMGGVNLRKGTDLLVRAFDRMQRPARLVIHSQAGLDCYGSDIAGLIRNNNRIEFIHRTVAAPGLYHLGDVYVYPTRLEGIGLTICEALAAGLPVITTDRAPMNEFVADGVTGALVRVADEAMRSDGYYWPEAYVDIDHLTELLDLYAADRELVLRQKAAARNYALRERNWSSNAEGIGSRISDAVCRGRVKQTPTISRRVQWLFQHYREFSRAIVRSRGVDLRGVRLREQLLF
ncbi:glycosyltransferase family 4 protein [Geobacter pelophilus]|uniref:Glycosyltransferase family 4 protein n=1 Tax=Geoanaerobacter pelophilus TaxID=60036 RepID=A0AAW4L8K3_9BACT|nr:glycosyltransferase family 4 protein [Geoanaerobacter pelophilus]MBT0666180.1 glycosyltransferase family 4 protein [Geoanaerobacter pelophilus]